MLPFTAAASISFNPGEGWPTLTKNGVGYGFTQDSSIYRYYGGQVFRAEDNFSSAGAIVEACSTVASTTSPVPEITVDVYVSDTYTPSETLEFATWEYLNTWGNYLSFCENSDIVETTVSGAVYFDDRTIQFEEGRYYALVIGNAVAHEDTKYSRTSPDTNAVSICGDGMDLLCGGYALTNSTSTYGVWLSFDGLAAAESIYGACRIPSLPYFDIQQCLVNAAVFLFVPSDETLDEWQALTLASTTPFGYLYAIPDTLQDIYATTSATWQLAIDFSTLGGQADAFRHIGTSSVVVFDACWLNRGVGEAPADMYDDYVMPVLSGLMWMGALFALAGLATRIF